MLLVTLSEDEETRAAVSKWVEKSAASINKESALGLVAASVQ